jgi:hypothetical protein
MHIRIAAFIAFLFGAVSLVSVAGPAHAMDMNCSDFDNQAQAQNYFENNGGSASNNVDGLDADGDGVVCESNPCPCSDGGGGGGGGGGTTQPKPFHKLTAQKGKVDGTPVAFGKVTTYKGERIRIMRRVEGTGFKLFKSVVTKAQTGKFNVAISSPQGKTSCFRVVVPATKKYKLTTKPIGCVG